MASLADLLEDYRNWRGRQEWSIGKDKDVLAGEDPSLVDFVDKFGGIGTDAGGLVGMIKASHGSPHAFTKFLMSKLGTGEGAQAYGHGLYFGEGFDSPVAKQYQENVKDMDAVRAINDRMSELSKIMESDSTGQYRKFKSDVGRNAASEYDALMDKRTAIRQDPGNLYNVELKWPDAAREAADPLGPEHFIDYDKPLSMQSEGIKELLLKANDPYLTEAISTKPSMHESGDYWNYLGNTYADKAEALDDATIQQLITGSRGKFKSPQEVSAKFKELGIPGIRYLDQGSRGAGQGTHNYVIFDENIPNIVSRNGVSLTDLLRR